jgi:uncharacterized protein YciI
MMLWIIHCLDGPGKGELRQSLRSAHSARMGELAVFPLVYGPLLAEDGTTQLGSLFVIEAADEAAAHAWAEADPFRTGGVWQEVRIHGFQPSDRSRVRLAATPAS